MRPFDASGIADAVSAVVRAVLVHGGKLVFGGHPTITPLVLMIGSELRVRKAVDVFQSEWFREQITEETWALAEAEVGTIHGTPRCPSLEESLEEMRRQMLGFVAPAAAVFVGGMSGIQAEYDLVGKMRPGVPRIPVPGPGGAAARLPTAGVPDMLREELGSRHYPFLAALIVEALGVPMQKGSTVTRDCERFRAFDDAYGTLIAALVKQDSGSVPLAYSNWLRARRECEEIVVHARVAGNMATIAAIDAAVKDAFNSLNDTVEDLLHYYSAYQKSRKAAMLAVCPPDLVTRIGQPWS